MPGDVTAKVHEHFSKFPRREYPKGQILVFADENPEHIFYVTKGRIRKYDVSYRGDEVIISIFKQHSFFPMSWAINHTPNKFFYKTETPVELHVVPTDDALEFLKANPDVMLDLLSRLYRGLEGFYGRMVHLMSGTARSRLLYELIIEARRFGEKLPDDKYVLQANETDLAARSGLSRETISREMKKLKSQGLVDVTKNKIVIHDLDALKRAHGGAI
jgi:CRP/FNR family transcriptional regulator